MGFITADRNQRMLFGYCLEDFVSVGDKCRFIVEVVKKLDLSELYADYSSQGGDAFDPGILLATWFFAYSEGISSTRKLERFCTRDMHYIYVSGNLKPDHCSLSRFRHRHLERLPKCFVEIVRLGLEAGISDFKRIAVDGSKLQASSSSRQNRDGKALEKDLIRIRQQISEYLERCQLLDEQEEEGEDLEVLREKITQLRKMEEKLQERDQQLEQRKKLLQKKDREHHKINKVEPEARNMKAVNGLIAAPGYNAQLSVDTASELIVATDVNDEPTDQKQFALQHQQTEENLGKDPQRGYVADAGYHSLKQLAYIEEKQIDAVIADPRPEHRSSSQQTGRGSEKGVFHRASFRYEKQSDEYLCPASKKLSFCGTENKRGRQVRIYRAKACIGCHLRARCIKSKNPLSLRRISRDADEALAEVMLEKVQSPEGLRRLRLRAMSVEPVFGNLKANLGFRRFRLRGLKNVRGEFTLMCISHNLNKLYKLLGKSFFNFLVAVRTIWRSFINIHNSLKLFWTAQIPSDEKSYLSI